MTAGTSLAAYARGVGRRERVLAVGPSDVSTGADLHYDHLRRWEASNVRDLYFSERERGLRPRLHDEINDRVWSGIVALIQSRIRDGSMGSSYPLDCPDGQGVCGCDEQLFFNALQAEHPDISVPLDSRRTPPTLAVLDLVEFCYRSVGKPIQVDYHGFFRHHHLKFDRESGQAEFRDAVNRVLERNGMVYELDESGHVQRNAGPAFGEVLQATLFKTGDEELDRLLETARTKFNSPNPSVRREGLEKLWDAFERLKSIEDPRNKRRSTELLIQRATSDPAFAKLINDEAQELTSVGNGFGIRHAEVGQAGLYRPEDVDYLFLRMFALIRLLLGTTGRAG